jgi:hypothetical protein
MFFKHALVSIAAWIIILKAVAAQHYPITGVHTGVNNKTGSRPLRRNINEFQKDIPTWYENESVLGNGKLLICLGLSTFKHL